MKYYSIHWKFQKNRKFYLQKTITKRNHKFKNFQISKWKSFVNTHLARIERTKHNKSNSLRFHLISRYVRTLCSTRYLENLRTGARDLFHRIETIISRRFAAFHRGEDTIVPSPFLSSMSPTFLARLIVARIECGNWSSHCSRDRNSSVSNSKLVPPSIVIIA